VLVVDANILIRAVLGVRVRSLIVTYGPTVDLFAPDTAWAEAREHLPEILRKRGVPVEAGLSLLNSLEEVIQPVEFETYRSFEPVARTRLAIRDPDDWPILATALALRSPIWTEDNDFFGAGVATWTTDRVELFLSAVGQQE
jgi:predicted nucleic acid-binding protein